MFSRRSKTGYFIVEGLHSFTVVYYYYYFYFYMQMAFGYGNKANLILAAANGAVYAMFCWIAGRFAERFGYFTALKVGFGVMLAALTVGSQVNVAWGQVVLMLITVVGMCFTWPVLEALVSHGESRSGVQHMVGIYNVVWAATAALAYFVGGAMLDLLGLRSLFYVPMATLVLQLALLYWLELRASKGNTEVFSLPPVEPHPHHPAHANRFLRMSWLANPFAYISINTLVAVMPGIANKFSLSPTLVGVCCSIWCFSRLGSFILLWVWTDWHYKFSWLILSYISLVVSFAVILLVPNLLVLIVAQLFLGAAIGLMYSSSLFYSMDLSDTKGEHGGIHESVIGLGNCAGPALGAASLHLLPQFPNSGAVAVSILLLGGLAGLGWIWKSGSKPVAVSADQVLAGKDVEPTSPER